MIIKFLLICNIYADTYTDNIMIIRTSNDLSSFDDSIRTIYLNFWAKFMGEFLVYLKLRQFSVFRGDFFRIASNWRKKSSWPKKIRTSVVFMLIPINSDPIVTVIIEATMTDHKSLTRRLDVSKMAPSEICLHSRRDVYADMHTYRYTHTAYIHHCW